MNLKKSTTSDPDMLVLNLTGKINLKKSDKFIALSNVSAFYTWTNIKRHVKQ